MSHLFPRSPNNLLARIPLPAKFLSNLKLWEIGVLGFLTLIRFCLVMLAFTSAQVLLLWAIELLWWSLVFAHSFDWYLLSNSLLQHLVKRFLEFSF